MACLSALAASDTISFTHLDDTEMAPPRRIRDLAPTFLGWTHDSGGWLGRGADGYAIFDLTGAPQSGRLCSAKKGLPVALDAAASVDGRVQAVLTAGGLLCAWDTASGNPLSVKRARSGRHVVLGREDTLAIGQADGVVDVRDPRSGDRT